MLKPYQARVVAEKKDLDDKLNKLIAFVRASEDYPKLHELERARLNRQLEAMTEYSKILGKRITVFFMGENISEFERECQLPNK